MLDALNGFSEVFFFGGNERIIWIRRTGMIIKKYKRNKIINTWNIAKFSIQ